MKKVWYYLCFLIFLELSLFAGNGRFFDSDKALIRAIVKEYSSEVGVSLCSDC